MQNNLHYPQRVFSEDNRIELEVKNKEFWKNHQYLKIKQHIFKFIERYKLPELTQGKTT